MILGDVYNYIKLIFHIGIMAKITGCVVSFFKSIFHVDTMPKLTGCTFYDGKWYFVDEKGRVFC